MHTRPVLLSVGVPRECHGSDESEEREIRKHVERPRYLANGWRFRTTGPAGPAGSRKGLDVPCQLWHRRISTGE